MLPRPPVGSTECTARICLTLSLPAERYEEWQRAFGGHDAMAATGAADGDVEARLLVEAQLAQEAAQVGASVAWPAAPLRPV